MEGNIWLIQGQMVHVKRMHFEQEQQEYLFDPKNVYVVHTVDTINIIKIIMGANDISCKPNFTIYYSYKTLYWKYSLWSVAT